MVSGSRGPQGPIGLQGPVGLPGGPEHFVHYRSKNYDVFEIPPRRMLEFCDNLHRSIPSFAPAFIDWMDQRGYRGFIHMDTDRRLIITDDNAAIDFKFTFV